MNREEIMTYMRLENADQDLFTNYGMKYLDYEATND